MDPERPIEKLLRQAARTRLDRVGGDFKLHPADRKVLQGEVARQFSQPNRADTSLLARLWPKLAFGAVTAAVIGLGLFWTSHRQGAGKEQLLASNRTDADRAAPAAQATTSKLKKETLALNESADSKAPLAREESRSGPSPGMSGAPTVAAPYRSLDLAKDQEPLTIKGESSGVVAPAPEGLAASGARAPAPTTAPGNVQRFAGSAPALLSQTKALPAAQSVGGAVIPAQDFVTATPSRSGIAEDPAGAVMAAFKLQQTGNQLRVIDQDGSVYTGNLQPTVVAADAEAKVAARRLRAAAADALASAPEPDPSLRYNFQVSGTNLTLNKRVVFTGALLASNTNLALTNASLNARKADTQNLPASLLLNSRVSGRVLVGDTPPRELDAVPRK